MPKRLLGRSRTCPLLAATSKSGPRYLLMVFALAGDSTITRFFFFRAATCGSSVAVVFLPELATIIILVASATHPYYTGLSSVKSGGFPAMGKNRHKLRDHNGFQSIP